jgi:hypothetical protein
LLWKSRYLLLFCVVCLITGKFKWKEASIPTLIRVLEAFSYIILLILILFQKLNHFSQQSGGGRFDIFAFLGIELLLERIKCI